MAALSVHRRGGGIVRRRPSRAQASRMASCRRELAATPPASRTWPTPCRRAARSVLATSTSTMASCTEAAQSGSETAASAGSCRACQDGRFQAAEGEVQRLRAELRAGQGDGFWVAVLRARQPVNGDAAGVGHPQQPGGLVERFPRRVVPRPPQDLIVAVPAHQEYLAVPARGDEADDGKGDIRLDQPVGVDVRLDVVDAEQGDAQGIGQRLRRRDADQQRPEQAGPVRDGHAAQVAEADAGLAVRLRR